MVVSDRQRAVGLFSQRSDVEYVLSALKDASFPMDRVSVIAKNRDVSSPEFTNPADEKAATGAVTGTVLGGITGLIVGLSTLAIPGVGPILFAGEIASTLATTAAGAGIGAAAGGLLGGLTGLEMSEEQARVYNEGLSRGDYLVIIKGTNEEVRRAETILRNRDIQQFSIFDSPNAAEINHNNPARTAENNSPVTIIDRRDTTI
ncbi:MAG: DUF1269 domain-containing protein [Desmonostoc vinosum HA7617-LM4]|jgi:hypothetical protein|nr:DUF1269 domain-containing protein [Desmonostoc vinosum HA7617-LM4]